MSTPDQYAQIVAAMKAAAAGMTLQVDIHDDLRGASVTGSKVQAYVVPRGTGFQVEMWHTQRRDRDPFKVTVHEDLGEAAWAAVVAASRASR